MPRSASSRIASPAVSPSSAASGSTMSAGSASGAATRGSPRCAGGASAASSGATTVSRAIASPTSAISTGCPNCFTSVHVIEHLGANLAPWNFADLRVEWRDGSVRIEDRYRLLFFHFHGVKRRGRHYFNSHRVFHAPFPDVMRHHIYEPYISRSLQVGDAGRALSEGRAASRPFAGPLSATPQDRLINVLRVHAGSCSIAVSTSSLAGRLPFRARDTLISLHPVRTPVQCAC